jgi:hypothetical protein
MLPVPTILSALRQNLGLDISMSNQKNRYDSNFRSQNVRSAKLILFDILFIEVSGYSLAPQSGDEKMNFH